MSRQEEYEAGTGEQDLLMPLLYVGYNLIVTGLGLSVRKGRKCSWIEDKLKMSSFYLLALLPAGD